jgi:hypothetical protein
MMRPSNDIEYVWLAREPQDFRKGINGLSIVVEEQLAANPLMGWSGRAPAAKCGEPVGC